MANEKIVTLENLTTYNDKNQEKITAIDERVEYLESNGIDKEMMKVCQRYDVNGIELFKILRGNNESQRY